MTKKIKTSSLFYWQSKIERFVLLLCFFALPIQQLYSMNSGQTGKILFKSKHLTIDEVFTTISTQLKYDIFYSNNEIDIKKVVELPELEMSLSKTLKLILGEKFNYRLVGTTIIITPRKKITLSAKKEETHRRKNHVKGWVYDRKKQALPGVTVKVSGKSIGTATNAQGWFEMTLPEKTDKLEFSCIGYKTKQVTLKNAIDTLTIILEEAVQQIDEVVVTGYQTLKDKTIAGSYSKIKAADLVMTGNESVESLLQGKIPGMVVINKDGLTGTRQKVRVRGTSTLLGNAEPIWVVDGIIQEDNLPFESSTLATLGEDNLDMMKNFIGGAISWLNPNDIKDITVLKDASATAIYGVKAANGVILITTKRGEKGQMSVKYSGNYTIGQRLNYKKTEIMNSKERVALSREAFERGARVEDERVGYIGLALAYSRQEISLAEFHAAIKKLEIQNTDWFDILYQTPFSQSHSVSFSGGKSNATYRVSLGYRNNQNTAKGNEQTTYTGNMNTSMIFWDKLTVTASISGSHTETSAFASGVNPYNYAINTNRAIAAYNGNKLSFYDRNGYNYNILHELKNSGNENTMKNISLNLNLRLKATENLIFSATLGGTSSNSFAETWFTEQSHYITKIREYEYGAYGPLDEQFKASKLPYGGMLSVTESRNFNYTARLQAEFIKYEGGHVFNLVGGCEARSNKYNGYSQTNWGYMPDRGKTFVHVPLSYKIQGNEHDNSNYARTIPRVTDRLSNYISYYFTGSYMYDNRYSINLSIRGDGSNRFGEQAKFQPVWAAGLRWNVSDEAWMSKQNFINNLAFMASLGYQGNVVENIGPDLITRLKPLDIQTGELQMTWQQLPNPDLKPEKTLSLNLGTTFGLWKNKITGNFNWYYKKTRDVITTANVPYESGTVSMYINDGHMTNKGWDFSFSLIPIRTKNFMWTIGSSFSGNSNNVNTRLKPTGNWKEAVSGSLHKEGYPVGSFWAFRFTGLNPLHGGPTFDLSRANTEKASEDATEYMVYMGTKEPKFTVGINMMFRWKRFSFPLNFYISRGNYEFLASPYEKGYMMMSDHVNASSQLNERWRKPGDERYTNIPSIPVGENCRPMYPFEDGKTMLYPLEAWAYSNIRVVNAWYIRFNDFQFSYNLPDKWIKGFAQSVSCSFTATNPLQIKGKDFKGRDPEVAFGRQPRTQNYSLGINLSF